MSDYQRARPLIRDGDLIAVRGTHAIDHLTSAVTRSPYTHTGVAIWLDGHVFMAELNSGRNHLTALSCVADFDVFLPPAGLDRAMIRAAVLNWLATPIDYGFPAFVAIGIQCMVNRKTLFANWRAIVVCSGGSVMIYEASAQLMLDVRQMAPESWVRHNRQLSPGELAAELQLALQVRASDKP